MQHIPNISWNFSWILRPSTLNFYKVVSFFYYYQVDFEYLNQLNLIHLRWSVK